MSLLSNILKKQPSPQPVDPNTRQQIVPTGQLLSNRYLVTEVLGRGAMGEVYLAEDTVLGGVSVAVKVMSQGLPTKSMLDKFSQEAQIGAFLGHHNVNIVRVLDFGVHNETVPFYVMEYVYGTTLEDEIDRKPLSVARAIRLMSQVCAGLQSAHQGVLFQKKLYSVIHRDLKPANIFVTNNSSFGEIAKILDFGISEFFLPTHKSTEADAMGTLAYGSGEQLLGKKLEPNSDIYSLGITLFESITGQLPIQPSKNTVQAWIEAHCHQPPLRLREVAPHLQFPSELDTLIQKCLEKKPKKRPQIIQEVLESLAQISDSMGSKSSIGHQSHTDVLDEIFGGAEPASSANHLAKPISVKPANRTLPSALLDETRQIQVFKTPEPQTQVIRSTAKQEAQRSPWPATKPMAEIVFAQTIQGSDLTQASLWAMLNYAEQQWQSLPCHHIEFMVELNPHPMLAWITILHDPAGRMRCLPCFIDLGDQKRRQLIKLLVQQREYLFMLFGQKDPSKPIQVASFTIDERQQQGLHQSLIQASKFVKRNSNPSNSRNSAFATSKQKLKTRYIQLKDELPQKLIRQSARR